MISVNTQQKDNVFTFIIIFNVFSIHGPICVIAIRVTVCHLSFIAIAINIVYPFFFKIQTKALRNNLVSQSGLFTFVALSQH